MQTYAFVPPTNSLSAANLALAPGTEAISKSAHFGTPCGLSCSDQMNGIPGASEDDFDEQAKTSDLWGYVWPQSYNVNRVVYETGSMFPDGGWFASDLRVQVRQNFQWIDVAGVTISPVYRYSNAAGAHAIYALILWDAWGDGVRIIGTPGGTSHFTTIGQLGVYYGLASIPPQNLKAYSPEKR